MSDRAKAVELAREWLFYGSRFGVLCEIHNGVYSEDQLQALASALIAADQRITVVEAEAQRLREHQEHLETAMRKASIAMEAAILLLPLDAAARDKLSLARSTSVLGSLGRAVQDLDALTVGEAALVITDEPTSGPPPNPTERAHQSPPPWGCCPVPSAGRYAAILAERLVIGRACPTARVVPADFPLQYAPIVTILERHDV